MIHYQWYTFNELTPRQLYDLLALRAEVFVVEQQINCADPDGLDPDARHLLGTENGKLVACLRLFPPTEEEPKVIFGRVLNAAAIRGKGHGKQMMKTLLDYCETSFPSATIKCSAQYYLKSFYETFGFRALGEPYEEEKILHILHIAMEKIPGFLHEKGSAQKSENWQKSGD